MVVVCLLQLCPILAYFFLIEALIELRKMLKRKKSFNVRFGNCSTPKVPRFCRFTEFTEMQLPCPTSRWKVRFRQTFFFKMKFKESFISWCWPHTLLIILVGFTAFQTSGLFKKQKNQICSYTSCTTYSNNYITI